MSLIEFIGFVISMVALVFLSVKKYWKERFRLQHPEEFAKQVRKKEEELKKFLKSIRREMGAPKEPIDDEEEYELTSLTQPKVPQPLSSSLHLQVKKPIFQQPVENYQKEMSTEKRALKAALRERHAKRIENHLLSSELQQGPDHTKAYDIIKREQKDSRAAKMIHSLPSAREMLVIKEVFGKPMSFRDPWEDKL